ncbi:hypothetical protein [uncultured Desulfovibrio sp.]|uniref:hypothetical protein n=1 Tax=uncultured Desulfovibrio sp. TaxID=167968 RepID=UPI002616B05A|nr:hypothetical protein [uncultured Desulfovibrio sp.]
MLALSAAGCCHADGELVRILEDMRRLVRELQDFLEPPESAGFLPQNGTETLKEAHLALARAVCFLDVLHDGELSRLLAGADTDIRPAEPVDSQEERYGKLL